LIVERERISAVTRAWFDIEVYRFLNQIMRLARVLLVNILKTC